MDSVTQIALGAAVGYASLGRRVGRRALLWGAVFGTLPDLDVLVPLGDPVAAFTEHRSWSHSLLVLALATPPCAWLAARIHRRAGASLGAWMWLTGLVLLTHVLLDCFTVYGTQLFWPFCSSPDGRSPESWSTVFVIDPAYTLPMLLGIGVAAWSHARRPVHAVRWNRAGLVLSSLYLCWTVGAKLHVEQVVAESLARQGLDARRILTTPTPLNSLLWRVVVMQEDRYLEGFHSVVGGDGPNGIEWTEHPLGPRRDEVLGTIPAARRLRWFTHSFCAVEQHTDLFVVRDLRMGSEPDYVFSFAVARAEHGELQPIRPERIVMTFDWSRLLDPWQRILSSADRPR